MYVGTSVLSVHGYLHFHSHPQRTLEGLIDSLNYLISPEPYATLTL